MANTEGMSDDALKDLLSTDSSPVVAAAAVSSRRRTGGSRAERLRRREEAILRFHNIPFTFNQWRIDDF